MLSKLQPEEKHDVCMHLLCENQYDEIDSVCEQLRAPVNSSISVFFNFKLHTCATGFLFSIDIHLIKYNI